MLQAWTRPGFELSCQSDFEAKEYFGIAYSMINVEAYNFLVTHSVVIMASYVEVT